MASANILDICTCGICLQTFDESSKCPRTLSCGHSFCHFCLGRILALNPCCPTCRAEILFQSPKSIPINYALKSLINIRSQALVPNTSTNHRTVFCDKLKQLQRLVQSPENDADFSKNLIELENSLEDVKKQIPELEKWLEDAKKQIPELEKWLENAKKQIPVDLSPRHLPQTLEDLGTLCQSRSVYAMEDRYDGTRYGNVALKDGRILVNSFQQEKPEDATLFALPELLSRFNNGSSELPQTVFLRLIPDGGRDDSFEVIIETDGLTPRAKNFILLCSALKGPSYKGETMISMGNTSLYYIPSAPSPVLEGIRKDDPRTPLKEGGVYGNWEVNTWFRIELEDFPYISYPKFGVVVAGLQELKDLQERNCSVEECGLII